MRSIYLWGGVVFAAISSVTTAFCAYEWAPDPAITVTVSVDASVETCKTAVFSAAATDNDTLCNNGASMSVGDAIKSYVWSVSGGTIQSGATAASMTYKAGPSCQSGGATVEVDDLGVIAPPYAYPGSRDDSAVSKFKSISIVAPSVPCAAHPAPTKAEDTGIELDCSGADTLGETGIDFDSTETDDFDFVACIRNCEWHVTVTALRIRYRSTVCARCIWTNPVADPPRSTWNTELARYRDSGYNEDLNGNCPRQCIQIHEDYHVNTDLVTAMGGTTLASVFDSVSLPIVCDGRDTASDAKTALTSDAQNAADSYFSQVLADWLAIPDSPGPPPVGGAYQAEITCAKALKHNFWGIAKLLKAKEPILAYKTISHLFEFR